jgi:hypothetical protein
LVVFAARLGGREGGGEGGGVLHRTA